MIRNTIFTPVSGAIACLLPLIALAGTVVFPESGAGYPQTKLAGANQDWVAPTFHGLIVGKSTGQDVIRVFGNPKWKGGVQDLVVPSDRAELQYQYSAVPDLDADMMVYFRKPTGVISAILLYPKHMTRADVIAKFGSDFEESNEKLGPCPTDRERKIVEQYHQEYGTLLVYRKLGLYVDIKKDGTAFLITYARSCR